MKMHQSLAATLLFTLLACTANAQVTISSADFLDQIGSRQVVLTDERDNITVDVGSAGENQVWDYREQGIVDTVIAVFEYMDPATLPPAQYFSGANFVQRITSPTDPGFELYSFFNVTNDFLINLGDSSRVVFGNFDTTFVFSQNDTLTRFPIAYGDTWYTFERDTNGFYPTNANISIDTTLNTVDAWGTVRLPAGDFSCLRIRQEVKVINQTIINGSVFSSSTDRYIQYDWISQNAFRVASIQSQNGETNPNFINAQGFSRIDSLITPTTGVAVHGNGLQPPETFALMQNYPNPFNPETVIRYQTRQKGRVQLAVFTVTGQQVRSLVNAIQPAGEHLARWDGKDGQGKPVSSGIYLYRLHVEGGGVQTKKMTLLR